MAKWREIKYYAKGTPTKTAMKMRRRHLFTHYVDYGILGGHHSRCGLHVFTSQFSEGPTDVQKCKHCTRIKQ